MKFNELFLMQRQLDEEIHLKHDTDYKKTMSERTLSFIVELGELANETRCFKYWSLKPSSPKNVVLEEYSDGIHFILSLGIAINAPIDYEFVPLVDKKNLTETFLEVYNLALIFKSEYILNDYIKLFEVFLGLGRKLGFSEDDIHKSYLEKNLINHQRQENKY